MKTKGIIQPSKSPWASPVVQKDGSVHFCVDYRKLNAVMRKDAYPLPRIDGTLQALSGSRWFTCSEAIGRWALLHLLHRKVFLSLMLCHLVSAMPESCSIRILWTECLVCLDDIIIFGHLFQEHLTHLASVVGSQPESKALQMCILAEKSSVFGTCYLLRGNCD